VKRVGGERPVYSALGIDSPLMRTCSALLAVELEWRRIVGTALASRSFPKAYEDGVLVVCVDGAAAMQDMNFRKNAIVREIRTKAALKIDDIRVEIGGRRNRAEPAGGGLTKRRARAPRVPAHAEEELVREMLARYSGISPELAHSIARCRIVSERGGERKKEKNG
jgi:hypothetical protein